MDSPRIPGDQDEHLGLCAQHSESARSECEPGQRLEGELGYVDWSYTEHRGQAQHGSGPAREVH